MPHVALCWDDDLDRSRRPPHLGHPHRARYMGEEQAEAYLGLVPPIVAIALTGGSVLG